MGLRIFRWQDLVIPVTALRAVGPRAAARFKRLGITTLRHLLWHLPWRYEAYEEVDTVRELVIDQKVHLQGRVASITNRRIFPRRMTITTAMVHDGTSAVRAVWFNQPYLQDTLVEGTVVSVAGKVKRDTRGLYLASPVYEKISTIHAPVHTQGTVPVYPETAGISSKYLRMLIRPLIEGLRLPDYLSADVRKTMGVISLTEAVKAIHSPSSTDQADAARRRLALDELLLFQLKALTDRRRMNRHRAVAMPFSPQVVKDFLSELPFTLTKDQKVAAWEILRDLERPYPMNRLLEGDVGSGKTIVALIAALHVARRGYQTIILAPTEVLAQQHHATICRLALSSDVRVGLLTAAHVRIGEEEMPRRMGKARIRAGGVDILIGTHAVLQKDVSLPRLALVVVDEQHRFGVEQRKALLGTNATEENSASPDMTGRIPHLLSVTATPIPRTLALTIFGDLDISLLRQKPIGRLEIVTKLVLPSERAATYDFVRDQVRQGRQVFVLCPRIEAADDAALIRGTSRQQQLQLVQSDVKAVEREYATLTREVFPDLRVAMLHGKMKPKEKEATMDEFRTGKHDILVATSVIEVGVDIPNAAIMLIEGAERFGLAQLHQFRGRVGRARHQSYCFLMPTTDSHAIHERLIALTEMADGFALAEKDMALRGPGEFFGLKQSGMPDFAMASLADLSLIRQARLVARTMLYRDPSLTRTPLLRERLEEFTQLRHFE